MDKEYERKSEGEDVINYDNKYDTNYEGDEFEALPEDHTDGENLTDDDDDFTLPRNHEQNNTSDAHRT